MYDTITKPEEIPIAVPLLNDEIGQQQNDPMAPQQNDPMVPQQNDPLVLQQNAQIEKKPVQAVSLSQQIFDNVQELYRPVDSNLSDKEKKTRHAEKDYKRNKLLEDARKQRNAYSWIPVNRERDEVGFAASPHYKVRATSYASRSAVPYKAEPPVQPDSMAGLGKMERSKLKSRQKSDLKKARKAGIEGASGDVYAYANARTAANQWVAENQKSLNADANAMVLDQPLTTLFAGKELHEKYENKNDPPYDIKDLIKRITMADKMQKIYKKDLLTKGRKELALGYRDTYFSLAKQAEMAALETMTNKLRETVDLIMTANGVSLSGEFTMKSEDAENAKERSVKALAEYNELTQNLDQLQADKLCTMLEQPLYKESNDQKNYVNGLDAEYEKNLTDEKKGLDPTAVKNLEELAPEFSDCTNATAYLNSLNLVNENPEAYAQHKAIIDPLFAQLKESYCYISQAERKAKETSYLAGMNMGTASFGSVQKAVTVKYTTNDEAYNMHKTNTGLCKNMVSVLLGISNVPIEHHILVQQKYGIFTEQLNNYTKANLNPKLELHDADGKLTSRYDKFTKQKPVKGQEGQFIVDQYNRATQRVYTLTEYSRKNPYISSRTDEIIFFCPKYDVDSNGLTLTEQDKLDKAESERIMDDFASDDSKKIVPYVTKKLQEALSYKVDTSIFSNKKFPEKALEIRNINNIYVHLDNLKNDYPWLVDELDPVLLGAFEAQFRLMGPFENAQKNREHKFGVHAGSEFHLEAGSNEENQKLDEALPGYITLLKDSKPQLNELATFANNNLSQEKNGEGREADLIKIMLKKEAEHKATYERDFGATLQEISAQKQPGAEGKPSVGILKGFLLPYKVSAKGEVLDNHDVMFKENTQELVEGLASKMPEEKNRVLDNILNQTLNYKYDIADFKPGRFLSKFPTIHNQATSNFAWLDSLQQDYPEYVEGLPQDKKQRIDEVKTAARAYWVLYCNTLIKMNVNVATGEPYAKNDASRMAQEEIYGGQEYNSSLATLNKISEGKEKEERRIRKK